MLACSAAFPACLAPVVPCTTLCVLHVPAVQENAWSPGTAGKERAGSTAGRGSAAPRGLLAALSGNRRVVVGQDENSLAGGKRLGRFQLDQYERLAEGGSGGS